MSIPEEWIRDKGEELPLPGIDLTPRQLFWVNWGQVWCSKYREAAMKQQIKTGAHSPGNFRIMGPLMNSPEFAEAFKWVIDVVAFDVVFAAVPPPFAYAGVFVVVLVDASTAADVSSSGSCMKYEAYKNIHSKPACFSNVKKFFRNKTFKKYVNFFVSTGAAWDLT